MRKATITHTVRDFRNKKFKKALDRTFLRLLPTRRILTVKDHILTLVTAYNILQTDPSTKMEPDKDFVLTSDVIQYLFQIAYKRPDLVTHMAVEVSGFLVDFLVGWASLAISPESVVVALSIICFFRKE